MQIRTLASVALLGAATGAAALDLADVKAKGVLRVIAAAEEAPETFSFEGGPNPGIHGERTAKKVGERVACIGPHGSDIRGGSGVLACDDVYRRPALEGATT